MAYVSKEKKAKIVAAAKKIIPADWKVTFSVNHHSTIVATISRAPASVLTDYLGELKDDERPYVNEYHLAKYYKGKTLKVLQALLAALNTDNYDRSDRMTDYVNVGHYVTIQFGRWNKACEFTPVKTRAKRVAVSKVVEQPEQAASAPVIQPSVQVEAPSFGTLIGQMLAAAPTVSEAVITFETIPTAEQVLRDQARKVALAMRGTRYGSAISDEALLVLARAAIIAMK